MKTNIRVFSILIAIIVPLLLMMTSIRILLNPFYLDYEYNLPNFPADEFGFTKADRLHWGKLSLVYLTNNAGPEFLADLKFDNGKPIYNERELSHMLDVKNLVQLMMKIMIPMAAFLVLAWIFAWRLGWKSEFWKSVSLGGWLTLGMIGLILIATVINFDALFTGFHHIFFTGSTWLFYTNDTLIRLFPEKLWSDAFTFMGVFTLATGVICTFLGARLAHRSKLI
jgi:integral membrane protein (TIGR01906 family)